MLEQEHSLPKSENNSVERTRALEAAASLLQEARITEGKENSVDMKVGVPKTWVAL